MQLYQTILSEITNYEETQTPISNIGCKYGFTIIDAPLEDDNGNFYTVYKSEKFVDDYHIILEIETKDKYRSFSNDDEPYRNTISIFKDSNLISTKSYTYWK